MNSLINTAKAEVYIKTWLPPASLSFKGQANEQTTVHLATENSIKTVLNYINKLSGTLFFWLLLFLDFLISWYHDFSTENE